VYDDETTEETVERTEGRKIENTSMCYTDGEAALREEYGCDVTRSSKGRGSEGGGGRSSK
jgi:hypothetical protein